MSNRKVTKKNNKVTPVTIQELIDIGNGKLKPSKNFDMVKMNNVLPSLIKLNNIIGMEDAKASVAKIVQYYMLDLSTKNVDMMHTMIHIHGRLPVV